MNFLFRRRVSLVALGFFLPVAAVWWKNRVMQPDSPFMTGNPRPPFGMSGRDGAPNSRFSPRAPRASERVQVSGPPVFSMETVKLWRMGPLLGQNRWNDGDCGVDSELRIANVVVPQPDSFPMSDGNQPFYTREMVESWKERDRERREVAPRWTLRDSGGAKLREVADEGWRDSFAQFQRDDVPYLDEQMRVPGVKYKLSARFDLDRVPLSRGVLTLGTDFKMPQGSSTPLQFEVRPAWFGRAPRTLQLESATWRAPQSGGDGAVVLELRERGARVVLNDEPQGSVIEWQVALDGKTRRAREIISERKLLYNWSPRLESEDGKYNSHAARDAQAWSHYRKAVSDRENNPIGEAQKFLLALRPKIEAQTPVRNGNLITLHYDVFGLKNAPDAQVFKAEIGVPGDGFLGVSVPLPRGIHN